MSCSRFSTGNADYWLILAKHQTPANEIIFDDDKIKQLDALVLEDWGHGSKVFDLPQYYNLTDTAKANDIPVYITDINTDDVAEYDEYSKRIVYAGLAAAVGTRITAAVLKKMKKMTRRRMLGLTIGSIACLGIAGLGFVPQWASNSLAEERKDANELERKIVALQTELIETQVATMRNAVNARKIEEHLAPMLGQRLGRKPRIAVVFGSLHAALKDHLQDKGLRDETISDFSDVLGQEEKSSRYFEMQLNTIYEFIPTESRHGFITHEYRCNCF